MAEHKMITCDGCEPDHVEALNNGDRLQFLHGHWGMLAAYSERDLEISRNSMGFQQPTFLHFCHNCSEKLPEAIRDLLIAK